MKNKLLILCLILATALSIQSCGVKRYLTADEHILYKNQVDIHMADSSAITPDVEEATKNIRSYYLQKPNSKVFGIDQLRVGMTIYGLASPSNKTFLGNYLRRIGQAPVVYDENRARQTARQLSQLLQSKGCFGSTATFDTIAIKGKDIIIGYHLTATHRRIIDEIAYRTEKTEIAELLRKWAPEAKIKAGEPYDQEKIAAERNRLTTNLRESGYYLATPENITFIVDTTYSPTTLSIDVAVDSRHLNIHHINNIYIYPNSTAGLHSHESHFDTLIYTYPTTNRLIDYQFIYDKPMSLRPATISRAMMLFPGMTYRPRYITSTYNSLLNLRNFKYINIEFTQSTASTDTLPLVDAHVRLINSTPQRISLSVELTNASPINLQDSNNLVTSGNLGIETSVEYRNNNLLGGAELLRIKSSLLLELPKFIFRNGSNSFHESFSTFEAGLDASLDIPIFLLPFTSNIVWQRIKPHTLLALGGSYQYHSYFERILANTSFGYTWNYHNNKHQHQLLPLEFTYVRILNLNDDFAQRINHDLRMKYQYSSHFIMNTRYDYTYTNQQIGSRKNFLHLHLTAESAGNILSLANRIAGSPVDDNGIRQLFGVPFSQYLRLSGDITHYLYHGTKSAFVSRLMLGIGLPYDNSQAMPYEKSFFGGGPTTLRAWQLRRLGPGSYLHANSDYYEERIGDLQLVINLEERFPIINILEGAIFADIGNVWLMHPSEQYPNGELQASRLLRDLAVGVGLGLRINISVATLRADFSLPLYDPGFGTDNAFRIPHWNIKQIVTNFGIGYPF